MDNIEFEKISYVEVTNLAGLHSFSYELCNDREIDILTGRNGLGKTSIFSILNSLFNDCDYTKTFDILKNLKIKSFKFAMTCRYTDDAFKNISELDFKIENIEKELDEVIFHEMQADAELASLDGLSETKMIIELKKKCEKRLKELDVESNSLIRKLEKLRKNRFKLTNDKDEIKRDKKFTICFELVPAHAYSSLLDKDLFLYKRFKNVVDDYVSAFNEEKFHEIDFTNPKEAGYFNADLVFISANRLIRDIDRATYSEFFKNASKALSIDFRDYDKAINSLPSENRWAKVARNYLSTNKKELSFSIEEYLYHYAKSTAINNREARISVDEIQSTFNKYFNLICSSESKKTLENFIGYDEVCKIINDISNKLNNEKDKDNYANFLSDVAGGSDDYFKTLIDPNKVIKNKSVTKGSLLYRNKLGLNENVIEFKKLCELFISMIEINKAFTSITSDVGYSLKFFYSSNDLDIKVVKRSFYKNEMIEFDLTQLSSGEQNLISLLLEISCTSLDKSRNGNTLILLDEPENSLHISWQEKIVSVLKSLVRNNKNVSCIISTHSPSVLENCYEYGIVPKFLNNDEGI